jgi:F-type H+-transporting ATPase subunit gamma
MANLKIIKNKIKSVGNLKKITRALEVVSTVKLQKSKGQAESLKEYLVALLKMITSVGLNLNMFDSAKVETSENTKELAIIVSTER